MTNADTDIPVASTAASETTPLLAKSLQSDDAITNETGHDVENQQNGTTQQEETPLPDGYPDMRKKMHLLLPALGIGVRPLLIKVCSENVLTRLSIANRYFSWPWINSSPLPHTPKSAASSML